jgi:hypothetical protein
VVGAKVEISVGSDSTESKFEGVNNFGFKAFSIAHDGKWHGTEAAVI